MKKQVLFLLAITTFSLQTFSQSQVILPTTIYNSMKANGELKPGVNYLPVGPNHQNPATSTANQRIKTVNYEKGGGLPVCNCIVPLDSTFSVAEFDGATPPDYRSDDGSTLAKALPFNFCLYGTNYNQFFINNNGNITLDVGYGGYSATGFPSSAFVMVAPFWSDVDTRNPGSGVVHYKITPTYAIVKWEGVARYDSTADLLNTFQVIITDGNDPILPIGNNIAFCYGDMQWTTGFGGTGGFGGAGATAGVNKGDGIASIQMGQFDQPGIAYDGSYGNYDGVDFLDKQSFYSNFCVGTNMAPIASGMSNCDTVKVCNLGDTLYLKEVFMAPEPGQNTTISVNLNGTPNATVVSNVSGNAASAIVRIIATAANAGVHTISFIGTDNGIPVGSTIINSNIFVDTSGFSISPYPVISGITQFCQGDSSVLSVTPTTYDNYVWSTVSSNTSTTVYSSGIYFVTATLSGCSKSTSINVIEQPAATPAISGFPFTCASSFNTTMLYCDSLIYSSYFWSNSNTADTIYTGAGIYYLTVTNAAGCSGSDTIVVTPITGNIITTLNGTTISASASGAIYQWIDCGNGNTPIAGATSQNYTATTNGNYAVIVSNGICSDTSACTAITGIGIHENNWNNAITIAPNPFTSQTIITFGEEQKNISLKIVDVLGKEVFAKEFEGRRKQITIDRGDLSKGIYFIQINLENKNVINKKIVIQ